MSDENNITMDLGPVEQFEVRENGLMINGSMVNHKELEKMAKTARTQSAGVYAVEQKTRRVHESIAEISISGIKVFDEAIGRILAIRDSHRKGTEQYYLVSSFVQQVVQELGIATIQASRIGGKWLLQIIYESPFPEPKPPRNTGNRTLIGRLLLGPEDYDDHDRYDY